MTAELTLMMEKVLSEPEYIPKGPRPQGELTRLYFNARMNSLGKKATGTQTPRKYSKSVFVASEKTSRI